MMLKTTSIEKVKRDIETNHFIFEDSKLKDPSGNTVCRTKILKSAGEARKFSNLVKNVSLTTEWDEITEKYDQEWLAGEPKRIEEFKRFQDTVMPELRKAAEDANKYRKMGNVCIPPNAKELWCNACQCSFDIFIPAPSKVIHCPFCTGVDVKDRDREWSRIQ